MNTVAVPNVDERRLLKSLASGKWQPQFPQLEPYYSVHVRSTNSSIMIPSNPMMLDLVGHLAGVMWQWA